MVARSYGAGEYTKEMHMTIKGKQKGPYDDAIVLYVNCTDANILVDIVFILVL